VPGRQHASTTQGIRDRLLMCLLLELGLRSSEAAALHVDDFVDRVMSPSIG
jgi:integrase